MTEWHYRAFAKAEHEERLIRVRGALTGAGLAGAVCTAPELLYYFTGYDAHTHLAIGAQALVLPADEREPILFLRDGDVAQSNETVSIGEVRPFRFGAARLSDLVADAARDTGMAGARIGIDLSGPTTNGALTLALMEALDGTEVSDCTHMLGMLRTVLSDAEIAYVRKASGYANIGIDTFYNTARIGMSEIELAAEIEYAMRSAGSDYFTIPTWTGSGPRSLCQHGMASPRKLDAGDLAHCEFTGVARRYQCVTMGSLVMGAPSEIMTRLAEGGRDGLYAGLDEIKPGARIGDSEIAYFEALEAHGLRDACLMRFGVGTSAAYPPVWENQISVQCETDEVWQPGMVFYIHSSLQSFEHGEGLLFGASFLITETGVERLDKAKIELVVVE